MPNRLLLILGATAIAAAVLVLTLLLGPTAESGDEGAMEIVVPLAPTAVAPGEQADGTPTGGTTRGEYAFRNGDRLTELSWSRIDPRPEGVSDVRNPVARTYFSPSRTRMLLMTAREGTVVAPDNQPRKGELRGDVVLTLFESADGGPVDAEGDHDVQMVVYLEDALFDLELGQVDSAGPVRLTGRNVDFRGTGLSMNYNQLRQRLERLEIARGDWLRFRPEDGRATDPVAESAEAPVAAPQAAGPASPAADAVVGVEPATAPKANAAATQPHDAIAATQPAEPDAPGVGDAEAPQYYRARFLDDVSVTSGAEGSDERLAMASDELIALFAFEKPQDDEAAPKNDETPPRRVPKGPRADDRTAQPATAPAARSAERTAPATQPDAPPSPDDALMAYSEDDVVIRWAGRLIVQPDEEASEQLAGPDDLLLTLRGAPVTVRTGREETIEAAEVAYLASGGNLRAVASEGAPIVITSPELGVLTGQQLVVDRADATGRVAGPGWLRASVGRDEQQPERLEMAWEDRLDLTFYGTSPTVRSARPEGAQALDHLGRSADLGAIRTATFRGGVTSEHPRFRLGGETVTLDLTEPDEAAATLRALRASGDVTMFVENDDGEQVDLAAQALDIDFEPTPDGGVRPTKITARDDVRVQQPNMRLTALHLVAETGAAAEGGAADALTKMEAGGGVEVSVEDRGLHVVGERLVVDQAADQVEIFGTPDRPARVTQPEGVLVGERVVLSQERGTLHVVSAGTLAVHTLPNDEPGQLHVAWRDTMSLDDRSGFAEFLGGVEATTASPTDRTRVTGDRLQLELEPRTDVSASGEGGAAEVESQRVRLATVTGDAVFTADSVDPGNEGELLTRVRVEGPSLMFDNRPGVEQVQVIGKGRMLIDDRRPAEERQPIAGGRATKVVKVAGRGATLFLWDDAMTLDAGENRMTMIGDVEMIHRPATEEPPILFRARRLSVDMQNTAGLASWTNESAPKPEVTQIVAEERVNVRRGDLNVLADRLAYEEATQRVTLTAGPGRVVRVTDARRPTPITGRVIVWDLGDNSFDITEPGTGVIPIE